MPKFFIAGILLFLLLAAAGSSHTAQARYIPWDCSDWQAFAHSDRATAILESLAENRGKTLYCGIDQSDTFAKAETWEAGRDHNERDGTVYDGERRRFRGFIAAQEGWLTDGESGITGQSIAIIFEFPKEPPRRNRRTKRLAVGTDPEQFPINDADSCGQVLGIICGPRAQHSGQYGPTTQASSIFNARQRVIGTTTTTRLLEWRTQERFNFTNGLNSLQPDGYGPISSAEWRSLAADAARSACRAQGARYAGGSADFGPGHDDGRGHANTNNALFVGEYLGIFIVRLDYYNPGSQTPNTGVFRHQGWQSRTWSATCYKKGPRR